MRTETKGQALMGMPLVLQRQLWLRLRIPMWAGMVMKVKMRALMLALPAHRRRPQC